jgi:hypothetical protein
LNEQTQKLAIYLAFGVFLVFVSYVVSSSVGYEPQALKDVASWLNDNTVILTAAFCFLIDCYVILKLKKKSEYSPGG